ncbi:tetratricopeptide repeat protein [Helicobacter mustelae]|uniref:Putative inner membrane protein n=1 Tax=Helicobacter mustelae (strain ATCC 43772 / CCUG 25715 / CIP 103759 / LMG 18044 / NCTC 12198 / R85-136P) TaxID=679897 RepID=D3UJ50_HELM1|nr:tetratricopeptide repeat protein [Helicobacter mustelae]CBG40525.1 putative inner membrane protein [Helicobacter mustelae 12198]SQH72023.1 putative inner membrane protein [Helicobacter mustelae]
MDSIVFAYRDPLFGIIILAAIITTIALFDYSRNKYRALKKRKSLEALAKSYEYTSLNEDITHFISLYPKATPSLIALAQTHTKSGNNEVAIQIYLSLLESTKHPQTKIIILQSLGITYLNAGFLQRAKDIFTQILKTYPRNQEAMAKLIQCYENMGEYQKAIEALECLDEIKEEPSDEENHQEFYNRNQQYFYLMILLNTHQIPLAKKVKNAFEIGKKNPLFDKLILRFLKNYDLQAFWDYVLTMENPRNIIDILWEFERESLPSIITNHPKIFEIFVAKGYFPSTTPCEIFELEVLHLMQKHSKFQVYLGFEYRCNHCKSIFPFDSMRCPSCEELTQLDLILKTLQKI